MENKKRSDMEECVIKYRDNFYLRTEVGYKKIILTTDHQLIQDGVQAIDDEFLKWFVKNPSCESVEVEKEQVNNKYGSSYSTITIYKYKIIIPKEEPKQENCCTPIGQIKRYVDCKGCDRKPKQETLEEAAERISKTNSVYETAQDDFYHGFIDGAKWQKNDCVQFINKLEDESFDGWSKEAISGYLTACMTIKQKYIDTLNGN